MFRHGARRDHAQLMYPRDKRVSSPRVVEPGREGLARRPTNNTRPVRSSSRFQPTARQIETSEIGLLQTAKGWAAFTARDRVIPSPDEHALLVIVEDADPFADGGLRRTITVAVDGVLKASGVLQ